VIKHSVPLRNSTGKHDEHHTSNQSKHTSEKKIISKSILARCSLVVSKHPGSEDWHSVIQDGVIVIENLVIGTAASAFLLDFGYNATRLIMKLTSCLVIAMHTKSHLTVLHAQPAA
jgi:hypothetical protein